MKPLSRAIIGGITALTLSLILSGCADRPGEPEISRTASVPAPTTAAPLPPLDAEEAARAYADALMIPPGRPTRRISLIFNKLFGLIL